MKRPLPMRAKIAGSVSAMLVFLAGMAGVEAAHPSAALAAVGADMGESVTLVLRAPDSSGLKGLARQTRLPRATRLARLRALVPSEHSHDQTARELRELGFRVTAETSWSMTVTGRHSLVASTFGSGATTTPLGALSTRLPRVPAPLRGLVAGAYPTIEATPRIRPAYTPVEGADFRNASAPANAAPSTGQNDAAQTVATIQLGFWVNSGLTKYALAHGLPDPVADGQYREVTVLGGEKSVYGGDEVAMDQEAILATAPSARQAAYFAPNSDAGMLAAFSSVLDDVTDPSRPTYDPHITALSMSWGLCEAYEDDTMLNAIESAIEALNAAGVTTFISSGDDGIYSCGDITRFGYPANQSAVLFPASAPSAVAVGGTDLTATPGGPNTGSNWSRNGWACADVATCIGSHGGSGGGVSGSFLVADDPAYSGTGFAGFPKPAYQSAYVKNRPFAKTTTRMVPDIADDAACETPFIYTQYRGNSQLGCGTSLAAPVSAAHLANTLGDNGRDTGVGDIHPALYRAYAETRRLPVDDPRRVFDDITVGTNGKLDDTLTTPANIRDPSVKADAGYDTVTGLGAVLWPALAHYVLGTGTGPGLAASLTVLKRTGSAPLRVSWKATRNEAAVDSVAVTLLDDTTTVFTSTKKSGNVTWHTTPGDTYTLTVTAKDLNGATTTRTTSIQP